MKELFGFDCSHYQKKMNWSLLSKETDFAIIRIGGRKRDTGVLYFDNYWKYNIENAIKNGVKYIGVYFFSQPISVQESLEEAEFVLNAIAPYKSKINMPMLYDCEYIGRYRTANAGVTKTQRTDYAIAYMDKMKASGMKCLMYASQSGFKTNWDTQKIINAGYKLCVARYGKNDGTKNDTYKPVLPNGWGNHMEMWQYTSKGIKPGLPKGVTLDLDVWYCPYEDSNTIKPPQSSENTISVITTSSLNIRKSYTKDSTKLGTYTKGTKVNITEIHDRWGKTNKGWISLFYCSGNYKKGKVANCKALNVRNNNNSITAKILRTLSVETEIVVLEEKNGWYRISFYNEWVSKKYITLL